MTKAAAASVVTATLPCPCGMSVTYAECCGRYHAGIAAPTAEALMRSRYTAYVLGLADYLLATWHPTTRPAEMDLGDSPRWLGLKVLAPANSPDLFQADSRQLQKIPANATSTDVAKTEVEFIARYKVGGRAHRLHELSRFVREDGRWYYIDGEIRE